MSSDLATATDFAGTEGALPTITIVYVVYNRREELRVSLGKMLRDADYDQDRLDVVVVDNASGDGSAQMVRDEFPQVRLIEKADNIGAPAWNDGFAVATGDWVLILDDDCYLPPDGLRRAMLAARENHADLVSFKVASTYDPDWIFNEKYRTGLLSFWGCAWLVRRSVLDEIGGYDPAIFMWANELEFMLRFFDRGYRHLHFPDVVAQHMKQVSYDGGHDWRGYRINMRHWGYIAAKRLRARDAAEALVALVAHALRDSVRVEPPALTGLVPALRGFVSGLRDRDPVRNPELSRCYRRNFASFASPWWLSRPPSELLRKIPRELFSEGVTVSDEVEWRGRRREYFAQRAQYYPTESAVLEFPR